MQHLDYQPDQCEALFQKKADQAFERLKPLAPPTPQHHASIASGYRLRAEFRIWHEGDALHYVMFPPGEPRNPHIIEAFPIAGPRITKAMPPLREAPQGSSELRRKLFQVEFLSTLSGELLITLIYHRPLDDTWHAAAEALAESLACKIIGRSRKQKLVLDTDWVEEVIEVEGQA